jgi:hypothetical protein
VPGSFWQNRGKGERCSITLAAERRKGNCFYFIRGRVELCGILRRQPGKSSKLCSSTAAPPSSSQISNIFPDIQLGGPAARRLAVVPRPQGADRLTHSSAGHGHPRRRAFSCRRLVTHGPFSRCMPSSQRDWRIAHDHSTRRLCCRPCAIVAGRHHSQAGAP